MVSSMTPSNPLTLSGAPFAKGTMVNFTEETRRDLQRALTGITDVEPEINASFLVYDCKFSEKSGWYVVIFFLDQRWRFFPECFVPTSSSHST